MFWYSWLLLALFVICSLFLIGSVLLQSGKGDIASALGGGGAQNAFGPRSAASTLARVTLVAACGFMILAFLFSMPNILGGGSVATELDKDPLAPKVLPTPFTTPAASPAPAATGQTEATPAPATSPAATPSTEVEKSGAKADDKAKADEAKKDAPKAEAATGSKDSKDAKPASK